MSEDHWLSASQIKVWMECKRKWSFQYQERLRGPDTAAQALGTETHRQLEVYYDHDTPLLYSSPDEMQAHAAKLAGAGLEFLPARDPELETEKEFLLISPRHRYYGFIDLVDPLTLTIYDHKTTSNFKYAKTPETLRHDVQGIIYAVHAMVEWQTPSVEMQWTYMRTRGSVIASPVRIVMTDAEAGPLFACIEDIADEIEAARGTPTLQLPPNPTMCSAYGGCPFAGPGCPMTPQERMKAVMSTSQETDDLLARLTRSNPPSEVVVSTAAEVPPVPDTTTVHIVQPGQINPPEGANAPEPPPDQPKAPKAPKAPKGAKAAKGPSEGNVAAAKAIDKLCLDCAPNCQHTLFAVIVSRACEVIRATTFKGDNGQALHLADYRDMPYGRGGAVLLAAVQQVLTDSPVDSLVVDTRTQEASICLNYLLANSAVIIRSFA